MPFGRHAGTPLAELPGGYLSWLETKLDSWRDPFRAALLAELARRRKTTPASPANGPPRVPARRGSEHRPASELPARTVCDRCGLPATAQKPLVHEACLHDEAPF
jgi:putative quorum-sensing-regulated virulence factor